MALEGTHIQFAIDVAKKYDVKDVASYLSGTVYPDSRYPTGVAREKTHFPDLFLDSFLVDDFHKGWSVHQKCDLAQAKVFNNIFADELMNNGIKKFGTDWWIKSTALKILMDITIFNGSQIRKSISLLKYIQSPNNEVKEELKNYNSAIQDMYDKDAIKISDAMDFWKKLGLNGEMVMKVEKQSEEYLEKGYADYMISAYKDMVDLI